MNQVTTNIAHFDRKPFQYRSLTRAMKMPNKRRENLLFGDLVDLVNSDSCNLLSKLSFWSPFVHSLDNHDLWLQFAFEWIFKDHTISQLPLLTASSTSSPIIAAATLILFKCSTWSFMMAINGVTTTIVNVILSCLHSNARIIPGKSWKISLFHSQSVKLWRHLPCRLRVLNSSFALRVYPPRLESRSALCLLRVRILDGT